VKSWRKASPRLKHKQPGIAGGQVRRRTVAPVTTAKLPSDDHDTQFSVLKVAALISTRQRNEDKMRGRWEQGAVAGIGGMCLHASSKIHTAGSGPSRSSPANAAPSSAMSPAGLRREEELFPPAKVGSPRGLLGDTKSFSQLFSTEKPRSSSSA